MIEWGHERFIIVFRTEMGFILDNMLLQTLCIRTGDDLVVAI